MVFLVVKGKSSSIINITTISIISITNITMISNCNRGLVGGFSKFSLKVVLIKGSHKLISNKICSLIHNFQTMRNKSISYRVK